MSARKDPLQREENALAAALRRIGEHIQNYKFDDALTKINEELDNPELTDPDASRLLAMVGDSEFKRGRYTEAAAAYLDAASLGVGHATLWLRPLLGHVRSLLKIPDVDAALTMAQQAVGMGVSKMAVFDEQIRLVKQEFATNGSAQVPRLPQRVSVVATKMGYLFLEEGEPDAAEGFFNFAVDNNKHGACRARQGLAKIALARGAHGQAIGLATESIRIGGFKAKTLSSWPILISARHQLGGRRISDRLVRGLALAPAAVRSRAVLAIVRELRKNDMRQWQEIADNWMANEGEDFPRVQREIQKLILSSTKSELGNASAKRAAAEQLMQMPTLGPREWIMAAKELVRSSLLDGINIDVVQLVASGVAKYHNVDFGATATHSLALACIAAKQYVQARTLFQSNIQGRDAGSPLWGKSTWALARMESSQGNYSVAAAGFHSFFSALLLPTRLRMKAKLLWVENLLQAGTTVDSEAAKTELQVVLNDAQDPFLILDFARQLQSSTGLLQTWGRELFAQGAALAMSQFNAAEKPADALAILFKLARRQVIDFEKSSDAIALWESLDDNKRDWLWSTSSVFWEYIGMIYEAYVNIDDLTGAEEFAQEFLDDPATPPEGLPYVGVPLVRQMVHQNRTEEGLALCRRLVQNAPRHFYCALAWYWLALDAYQQGLTDRAHEFATRLREAQGMQKGLLADLDARALLILADMIPANMDTQAVNYDPQQLARLQQKVSDDMALFQ